MYIDLDEGRVTNAATLSHELDFIVRMTVGPGTMVTPSSGTAPSVNDSSRPPGHTTLRFP